MEQRPPGVDLRLPRSPLNNVLEQNKPQVTVVRDVAARSLPSLKVGPTESNIEIRKPMWAIMLGRGNQIAVTEKCSRPPVLKWINEGKRPMGTGCVAFL